MVLHVTKILGAKRTLLSKDVRCRYQCEMSVLSGKNMHPPRKSNLHYFAGASTGSSCMVGYGQKDMNPVNYCEPVFMNPNRRRSFPQFLTRLQGGHECNHCNPKINSVFFGFWDVHQSTEKLNAMQAAQSQRCSRAVPVRHWDMRLKGNSLTG